jgi:hypothetical protein
MCKTRYQLQRYGWLDILRAIQIGGPPLCVGWVQRSLQELEKRPSAVARPKVHSSSNVVRIRCLAEAGARK